MPHVTLIDDSGAPSVLDIAAGQTLMMGAVSAGLPGIVGECGGSAMCATCHVYIDAAWADELPAPLPSELEMLESTADERTPHSRLSCQIMLSDALDGLVVRLPARQQ